MMAVRTANALVSGSAIDQQAQTGVLPPGFVRLSDVAPSIVQDVRYAGADNFIGRPIPGYEAADCWARRETAHALANAAADAAQCGYRLVVYDCYRPQRATDFFVRWAEDPGDQIGKARYYPRVDKASLFTRGYIGRVSRHSAGVAVDLALQMADGAEVDFGSPFDLFDPRSATASRQIRVAARANRMLLRTLMERHGFVNYPREWWHYTLKGMGDAPLHDIPVTR